MRTYYIDSTNKTINLSFDYEEKIIKAIKLCDYNTRWNPMHKQWIIPVNVYSKPHILSLIKRFDFSQRIEVQEDEVSVSYKKTEVDYAYLKGMCDSRGFTYTARDYQLEALGFGLEKGNIINGDDVGLGKTFESILYAETTNSFPCLVITPASVKDQWKEKWSEITDNKRSISAIISTPPKRKPNDWNADVVVINYDILGKKQGRGTTLKFPELGEVKWKMIIFDEAHFLKNKASQRAQASKTITKKLDATLQLLSGTVTMNKPVELWNLLKIAKVDHLIAKDWFQFIQYYCGGYRGKFGWVTDGATNTMELNRRMRENFYIRREKREVLPELPEAIKTVLRVPITNKREIARATDDFISFVRETKGDEKAEKAMEAEHLVALSALRQLAVKGKIKAIEQYLNDWKQSDLKLLVFGLHREELIHLSEKYKCPLIAGGTDSSKKRRIVLDWASSEHQFLFANMQSAGTGVDGLQDVCSNMIIIELPWRPSDITQAIGRLDRSGQKLAPNVVFLLADDTIDTEMWEMLSEKEQITEAVNKGIDVRKQKSGMKAVLKKILKKK